MMSLLLGSSILTVLIAIAHSWLGEKYIIIRLLRRDNLPKLFGRDTFTKHTIRFAWHLTTAAWLGLAAVQLLLSGYFSGLFISRAILIAVGITFFACALLSIIFTRGRHLSWIIFLAVSILCLAASF